jgi:ABC-type transport system involved in multi-copper enzyme maturation permease subunit
MKDLLHAEWTKLRTVRGWVVGLMAAAAAMVALGLVPAYQGTCDASCKLPVGPGGEEVTDSLTFFHQTLAGDGTITARLAALTGRLPDPSQEAGGTGIAQATGEATKEGLVPWAKAGLIIKASTRQGSAYAAVMATGGHGVHLQYNYTHDVRGSATNSPVWLRLDRAGDTITGSESTDGVTWKTIGAIRLEGLPASVQWGMFATSPQYAAPASGSFGLAGADGGPTQATGTFDHLSKTDGWTGEQIGGVDNASPIQQGGTTPTREGVAVTGSGDIAPAVAGAAGLGTTITQTLIGTFAGLVLVVVVGALFITAEYRRGLIRTTLTASPLRGRVVAAKAIVLGAVTFLSGLAGAAIVVVVGQRVLRANGVYVHAVSAVTEARVIAGTAALLAVSAVLALAVGAMLRRGATVITAAIVGIVLPYLLAMSILPAGAARWVLRVTPAAAFALQQSTAQYPQVDNLYTPVNGYFPLAPWVGFAVLCGWTAVALLGATLLIRRRDA